MDLKKLTAVLCTITLIFSLISIPAFVGEAAEAKYMIINDNFGENDLCGWERNALSTCRNFATISTEEIGGGNYALTYESVQSSALPTKSDWYGEYLQKELSDGGLEFTEGINTVIKTRIKTKGTGRAFLKINAPLMNSTDPWNFNWGSLFSNEEGSFYAINGWPGNTYPTTTAGISGLSDKWCVVMVTIHGNTKTATFEITPEGGETTTYSNLNIDYPDVANMEEDFLKKLVFRLRAAEKLYVDYIQVWQEGIKVTEATAVAGLDNVDVSLTSNAKLKDLVKDYIDLYNSDGSTKIETVKSFDADTNVLKLVCESGLVTGETYKVKIDTDALFTDLLYKWEADSELTVQAPEAAVFNLGIEGELVPNTNLEAVYDLVPNGALEDISEFIWYTVNENGEKTEISGQTGKYFPVTTDYVDSTITYSMVPKCIADGETKTGVLMDCQKNVKPLSAPVITNPKFAPENPIVGYSLSASYDYFDADGDGEDGSLITWYKSDAFDGSFEEFATGKTIEVTEKGMYYQYTVIPKNGALFREEGEMVTSPVSARSNDIIEATNLFVNGDAEDGIIAPWDLTKKTDDYNGLSLVEDSNGIYDGNYAFRMHPRVVNGNTFWQEVTLGAGKTYIVSAMIKSTSVDTWNKLEGYVMSSNSTNYTKPYRMAERTDVSDEWTRVSLTLNSSVEEKYKIGWLSFEDAYGADAYIDDMYVGELMISDILTNKIKQVTIPKQGKDPIKVSVLTTENGKILNQFGETDGLIDQKATVSVPADIKGVTVKDNVLYVDSNAVTGKVNVMVKCVPDYNLPGEEGNIIAVTPAQSEFVKTIEIELVAHDDKTPYAQNVDANGTVALGNTLTGYYDFYQVDNETDASTVRWLYSDSADGTYYEIPGATGMTYTVTSDYADKFIKFAVTPKTQTGLMGTEVMSDVLVKPTAPVAKEISVSGDFKVGGTVTGTYKFEDYNRDNENEALTTFKWYVADSEYGQYNEIPGQTGTSLILGEELIDKYIKFSVTPVADAEPYKGTETFSNSVMGPVAPVATNVSITANGARLSGNYKYYHKYNAREKESLYKWTVDGTVVSTTTNYTVNFTGTKVVTFTVTPVGDTNPSTGNPVSVSVVITGTSDSVGGGSSTGGGSYVGGGGASGGGTSSGSSPSGGEVVSGIVSINKMEYEQELPKDENKENQSQTSDINGHWGEEYIKTMESRGVMSKDESGKYNPDELVTRESMLTYLFKTLKLESTDYSGMFEDVNDGEFAGMLQTMVDNGTISVDTTFRPNDSISREEMCKILYISLQNAGKLGNVEEGKINSLADFGEISDWAVKYVNAMYGTKMMIGVSEERFAPKENLTKAQAATLLTRIISLVEGE